MYSTHTAELPFPELPLQARQVHLFPALGDSSLLSLGTLLSGGCKAHFEATTCTITYKGATIITGTRDPAKQGLWLDDQPANTWQPQSCPCPGIAANSTTNTGNSVHSTPVLTSTSPRKGLPSSTPFRSPSSEPSEIQPCLPLVPRHLHTG
jgi:hypothetical protein